MALFSEKVMEHFLHPRNVGEIEHPDGVGEVGNPICGDQMVVMISAAGDRIRDVKFKTFGCAAAIAVASMVSEMAKGKTLEEGLLITSDMVAEELGGLPPNKLHCSNLGADALHRAIEDCLARRGAGRPAARRRQQKKARGPRRAQAALLADIERLKKERGAVILAHNYQPPEIQDIADFIGDSLDLSRTGQKTECRVIIFCGVRFMAETAAILSPEKRVILPEPDAGCPMADMITAEDVVSLKREHPGAAVVMYVNSTAAVKAHSDICCTSANAVKVVASIPPEREIIFGPDQFLGAWVERQTGRRMILWKGYCPSHQRIFVEQIRELRRRHPGALVMVHPEVNPAIAGEADAVLGTGGMIRLAGESPARSFIVGTEIGMIYRLQKAHPAKEFIPASGEMLCPNMKKISLEKVLRSLETLEPAVVVPADIAELARGAIRRMLEIA